MRGDVACWYSYFEYNFDQIKMCFITKPKNVMEESWIFFGVYRNMKMLQIE